MTLRISCLPLRIPSIRPTLLEAGTPRRHLLTLVSRSSLLSIAHRDALAETNTCLCCGCVFAHSHSQIGINYTGSNAPLAGCVNDIRGWADLFRSVGCSFNVHIVCRQVLQRCSAKHNMFVMFLRSDEDSRISGTERQRGAKKSDILSALQDIRGAMIASVATHK